MKKSLLGPSDAFDHSTYVNQLEAILFGTTVLTVECFICIDCYNIDEVIDKSLVGKPTTTVHGIGEHSLL